MSNNPCLQDHFLRVLLQDSVPVSIFLVNGIKLHGVIDQYDDHTIMLKNTITQMVYKHSISTVVPSRLVSVSPDE